MSNPELRGDLQSLLEKVHLQHHLDAVYAWCEENGAWDAHELAAEDVFGDIAVDIGLTELESQSLKAELEKIAWLHTVTEKTSPLLPLTSRRCWSYPGEQSALVKNSLVRRSAAVCTDDDSEADSANTTAEGESAELDAEPHELIDDEGFESETLEVFEQIEEQSRQISTFSIASGGFCRQETEQYWPTHSSLSNTIQPELQRLPMQFSLNDKVPCTPEQQQSSMHSGIEDVVQSELRQQWPIHPGVYDSTESKLEQFHDCTRSDFVQVAQPVVFVPTSPMMYPTLLNHSFVGGSNQEVTKVAPTSFSRRQRQTMQKPKSLITLAWEAQQRKKQQQHQKQQDNAKQLFRQLVTGANLAAKEESQNQSVPKFCHSCGNGHMPHFKFCPFCSAPVVLAP